MHSYSKKLLTFVAIGIIKEQNSVHCFERQKIQNINLCWLR